MKTSATQFEMLVNYMAEHGDLNKPQKTSQGRITNIRKWEELTHLLNGDPTGGSKGTEKWKKVWSDLKNNTKKKSAKINRAASGTGGGPAQQAKLSNLELRVLQIIGVQAATGFTDVVEAGLYVQAQDEDPDRTLTLTPTPHTAVEPAEESPIINIDPFEPWNVPGPSQEMTVASVPPTQVEEENVMDAAHVVEAVCDTPPPGPSRVPAQQGQTPRGRRRRTSRRVIGSPRHRRTQTLMDRVAQNFLHTDDEWRELLIHKHAEEIKLEKERSRIRELELQTQQKWQEIASSAVDVLHKISNSKLCKD
ncbi:uncharacterized protein [Epargyreus clarus]|uniref:uncharacterized protein n=1 Tax=Epargyreus clarus TaxID=520877 RepID=UPI003C2E7B43